MIGRESSRRVVHDKHVFCGIVEEYDLGLSLSLSVGLIA